MPVFYAEKPQATTLEVGVVSLIRFALDLVTLCLLMSCLWYYILVVRPSSALHVVSDNDRFQAALA